MFFVKATYRGETRKLTFPTCSTFPAFDELCEQLCRVFPLSQGFTISRLLFSPTPVNSIRLLVGQKVQSAEDYLRYFEPYRNRLWPDAMLRLTVLDDGPLNGSSTKQTISHYSQSNNATFSDYASSTQTPLPDHSISMSCVPPPPILFPSYSATTTPLPNASPLRLQTPGSVSNDTVVPDCSSVDGSKKEIQALLHGFMHDLNGLLANTFPVQDAETPHNAPGEDVGETQFCARCQQGVQPTSYYCTQCSAAVCRMCFVIVAGARCDPKTGSHRLERRTFVSNHAQQPSAPPVPLQPAMTEILETSSSTSARTPSDTGEASLQCTSRRAGGNGHKSREVVHNAVCDLCDSGIRGVRYKCLVCPDFDSCSSCFTITNEQHPNHSFVKIADPADYIHRLGSRPRHHAVCNVCNDVIYGTRYKCVHPDCPDYDLCDCCESHPIPLHPQNHPMVKLKAAGMSVDVVQSWTTERSVASSLNAVPAAIDGTAKYEEIIGPVIEEYEKTISAMEAELSLNRTALRDTNNLVEEKEEELAIIVERHTATELCVEELKARVAELTEREAHSEAYVRDLPLSGSVFPRVPKDELATPIVAVAQTESQPQSAYDWRSSFLPPEWQVSRAMFSPPITNEISIIEPKPIQAEETRHGSETPSTLEYTLSEASEVRRTLSDSPSAKEALSVDTSGDVAIAAASVPASSPAPSILRNNLEKEREFHVPVLTMHAEDSSAFSGQTLPPGAEFIKSWRVQNTGSDEWPETTELVFTGGDSLTQITAPVLIGSVSPGAWVEISTHLLKAPTVPGNYLSCWSLRALQSGTFGDSLWVSVNVVEQSESSEESLSSSSIMKMPQSISQESNREMIEDKMPSPTASERLTEETLSDISSPANLSFDEVDWQDCPAEQEEYVILYDDSSSDGE